jgi:aminoglycoside phosphotransferase (APT) family kinase protein
VRGQGGQVSEVIIPKAALRATAKALARLHQSRVSPRANALRSGAKEALRASARAAIIARYYPAQADEVLRLGQQLAASLEHARPANYGPGHGGFKPSQLLIDGDQVFIVDFDGFCLADPALDIGYFLAYLRPSGLWPQRPGMRQWFEAAAALFMQAYQQALLEHGVDSSTMNEIRERSSLYEAALLFKIATRRVHRLNSPRPQELAAMLREISACLSISHSH